MSPRSASGSKGDYPSPALVDRGSVPGRYVRLTFDGAERLSITPPDLSDDLRTYLTEQLSNEKKPTDGQAYRKNRQHCLNPLAAARWWACLTENKQQELRRLL